MSENTETTVASAESTDFPAMPPGATSLEVSAVVLTNSYGNFIPGSKDEELEGAIDAFLKPGQRYKVTFTMVETGQECTDGTVKYN